MNPWDNDPELTAAMEALRVATAEYEVARKAADAAIGARDNVASAWNAIRRDAETAERAAAVRWVEALPLVKVGYVPPGCRKPRETLAHLDPDGGLWVVETEAGRWHGDNVARRIGKVDGTVAVGMDVGCRVVSVVEVRP
jgi:hypothetical protein